MARPKINGSIGVRVADFGVTGGEFETGWVSFEGGGVLLGEATGARDAATTDFVVAKARLTRSIRPGQGAGSTSKFLSRLLDGTQTTPVDVEVRLLNAQGVPVGRGFLFQVAVVTSYTIDSLNTASKSAFNETFEFVAKDVQIVRS